MKTSNRRFRALTGIAIFATFCLIVLGAVIRATNSGLSCPDWPVCYGFWVPTPAKLATIPNVDYTYLQVMYEWVHRFIAGVIVGPLVLVLAIWALTMRRENLRPGLFGIAALALLLVQGLLGGLTVLDRNSPWSVAVHLGNAQLVLAMLIAMYVSAGRPAQSALVWTEPVPRAARLLVLLVAALALSTIASGAMMAKNGASLACSTWPLCDGEVIPPLDDPLVALHFTHRVLAGTTALSILALFLWARSMRGRAPGFSRDMHRTVGLVALQVCMGAAVIMLHVPVWTAATHQAMGVLVLASLVVTALHAAFGPETGVPRPHPKAMAHHQASA
ncbi:cytochrome oxidase assembly protein [Tistrella bauzanensis]|uniref:Cytochrome oxidase assembly protein n=1 Tax=Tistrella bauzanensis TaxID=657419 RepID=A0ABQ1IMU8_9PROT|nr:COX15/CtaA family protein [Tistrella bauzanensis]GGB46118.1 cytochrome oxidase assembly protein [Tistrella bauzanensis]